MDAELSASQRRHVAGLMRVNHTGEVCAQALYQGQALTAKLPTVRKEMQQAAREEVDHLVWCEERLRELGSHTSYLNPAWYGLSFALGAVAGAISDKVSLGFVAATEERVCSHLRDHLKQLPDEDRKSQLILQQMLEDEQRHGEKALEAGGADFPRPGERCDDFSVQADDPDQLPDLTYCSVAVRAAVAVGRPGSLRMRHALTGPPN